MANIESRTYAPATQALIDDETVRRRMNDPVASAYLKGKCGDTMEFYLVVDRNEIITDVSYYTDGCGATTACAAFVAHAMQGKSIREAMATNPAQVLETLSDLDRAEQHCAILAVTTMLLAIGDYLLLP